METKMTIKREIYISVVATIIVIMLIEPIIKWVWENLIWVSNTSFRFLTNQIYENASLGHRNYLDVLILFIIISSFLGIVSGRYLYTTIKKKPILGKKKLSPKLIKFINIFINIIGITSIIFISTTIFIDLQLNTSFQQRLTVLAPEISNHEHLDLLASWAKMQNRVDYEAIISRMEDLAQQNNIILPKLLLK